MLLYTNDSTTSLPCFLNDLSGRKTKRIKSLRGLSVASMIKGTKEKYPACDVLILAEPSKLTYIIRTAKALARLEEAYDTPN